jgi:hypothetical protein
MVVMMAAGKSTSQEGSLPAINLTVQQQLHVARDAKAAGCMQVWAVRGSEPAPGAAAHVQSRRARLQLVRKQVQACGMHVRRRDGLLVAYGHRRVLQQDVRNMVPKEMC